MTEQSESVATPRTRNWKSYLFEFILLFLAVTLGFFVEMILKSYGDAKP